MATTLQRNDPCRCGSGKKYKHCCQQKDLAKKGSKFGMIALGLVVLFGLALAWLALSGDSNPQNCPPGTTWSSAHQHCH
ncbi:MAG TPA: SEC-C metal-binding domain-containing protein [Balneolaceae bacterium]|nr:SEC-C metal-binding domain-containing protein [Balneolaceae bacterium]